MWIYAQQGGVKLIPNSASSDAGNRIEANDKPGAKAWAMIEIVYDLDNSKWVIMQNHQ